MWEPLWFTSQEFLTSLFLSRHCSKISTLHASPTSCTLQFHYYWALWQVLHTWLPKGYSQAIPCKQLQFVKSLHTNNGVSAIGYPCKNVLTLIISFVYCKLGPSACNCIVVLCGTFILVLLDQQGTLKWQMLYVDYVRGEDAKLSGSNSILIESTLFTGPK